MNKFYICQLSFRDIREYFSRFNPRNYTLIRTKKLTSIQESRDSYKTLLDVSRDSLDEMYRMYVAEKQEGITDFPLEFEMYEAESKIRRKYADVLICNRYTRGAGGGRYLKYATHTGSNPSYLLDYLMYKDHGLFLRDCKIPAKETTDE